MARGSDWKFEGFKYRPGDDLEQLTPVIRPTQTPKEHDPKFIEERFWSDGMVRVSGREFNGLVESPCFQKGTMSCLSCHSLHQSHPNDQLARGMESNAACTQCHEDIKSEHTGHAPNSSGSLCYNCHMPHTTYGLMKAIRSHQVDSPSVQASIATGRPNACNLCHLDKTLAWTAGKLTEWFGAKTPDLSHEENTTSAAALWTLRGDAGQRALLAWHMGWKPAHEASGENWLAPYLGQLLEDPYSTVRYMARRSLRALPEFQDFEFDYIGPVANRALARQSAWTKWEQTHAQKLDRSGPEVLIRPDGQVDRAAWERLLRQRDEKSIYLQE
jgi:predicted CXXCH cytochrome family protein